MTGPTTLDSRSGLPSGLDHLLLRHPRSGWPTHPELGPLTTFWLDRHLAFRDMLHRLRKDAEAAADGTLDPADHAGTLSRIGGTFLQQIHDHHTIEDDHYFPRLVALAPTLERGFAILDADHHALHDRLDGLARAANAVLRGGGPGEAARLADDLSRLEGFLNRHLTDEEDLVVPIILDVGEARLT
ncbi:MAG: hemerythrin domain-containing protein [Jannaschia sp.]